MNARREGGFTLIEVVIALVIVAAMLAIMFGGLRAGLAVWRRGEAHAEGVDRVRTLGHLLTRALATAQPYRSGGVAGEGGPVLLFEGDRRHVAFVTSTPPLPFPVAIAFTAVTLSWEEPGLTVRQKALPNREPFEAVVPSLVDGVVKDIRFRYRGSGQESWEDRWDTAQEKALPGTIEITLVTEQHGRRTEHPPLMIALHVTGR